MNYAAVRLPLPTSLPLLMPVTQPITAGVLILSLFWYIIQARRHYVGPVSDIDESKTPSVVVEDADAVVARALRMVHEGVVEAVSGEPVALRAQTLCLHGDGPQALNFARSLRLALDAAGVTVKA